MMNAIFYATIYNPTNGTAENRESLTPTQAIEILRDALGVSAMIANAIIHRMADGETWADYAGRVQMVKLGW